MNLRLTVTAAVAVILASVSLYPLIQNAGWFWAGVGAVIAAAVAGVITRLPTLRAAVAGSLLALVAVYPLLASPYWGLKVAGAAVVAVTAASRPRLRVVQALACLIIYLAALLIYLNAVFASRLSVAGLVPTRASLAYLSSLVNQGMAERIYQPPVPSIPGVILLAAGGIGLMAAATDLLAVRLRSPAIAGLPLLALYCVRITTAARQGGVGATVVFCLAMIGYLALLAADGRERLRIWGRLVTVWQGPAEAAEAEAPDTRALAASGRRIGLAAACIALAFPLLVPGISVHDLFQTEATADGPGGPPIAPPNPLVQMQNQLLRSSPQTVLTYTTTAKQWQEQYLQVYVLNYDYAGQAWKLVPLGAASPAGNGPLRTAPGVTGATPRTTTTTKITLSQGTTGYDAKLGFLPLPYAPEMLQQIPGGWAEDDTTLMVYSTQPQMSGMSYTVTSEEAIPDGANEDEATAYPANIKNGYLAFPAGPHDQLAKLARQITAHAHTKYDKALALESYFLSGKFTYSTSVTVPAGIPGLIDFLYFSKSGYCQQFAFAMAGLARLIGIPSRIAVGYTAGTSAGKGTPRGTRKVTTADAHAWPELYFSGLGWIRFEPTPGGAAGQGTATVPQYAAQPGTGTAPTTSPAGQKNPGSKVGAGVGRQNAAHLHGLTGTGTGGTAASAASDRSIALWVLLIIAIIAAAAAVAPPVARSLVRRRRLQTTGDARLAHAMWREVRDDLADYGLAGRPSESPRAVAARVTAAVPLDLPAREALARIVSAEERARYATAPLPSPTLRADGATFRRGLAHQASRTERWRARLLPASMLTPIRPALQHALDVFGWMDAAGQRLRGREPGSGELSGRELSDGVRPQE
jgi:transglutaminase-like putative cysteine protease